VSQGVTGSVFAKMRTPRPKPRRLLLLLERIRVDEAAHDATADHAFKRDAQEGFEQSFNSLGAQREACQAFILSQRPEGWRALPARHDDGGYSSGTSSAWRSNNCSPMSKPIRSTPSWFTKWIS
jgi:hypothetical protein